MPTVLEEPATRSGLRAEPTQHFSSSSWRRTDVKGRLVLWSAPTGVAISDSPKTTLSRPDSFRPPVAPVSEKPSPNAVAQLRDISGLTAGQLARALGVSRRSIQGWIAGSPMAGVHAERVSRVLKYVQGLDGAPEERRAQLLDSSSGLSVFHAWEQANGRSAEVRPQAYSVRDLLDV